MQIITEQQIAEILDPEIAFFAVQDVFKSMETLKLISSKNWCQYEKFIRNLLRRWVDLQGNH